MVSAWEQRVQEDAKKLYEHMSEEYRKGNQIPFSVKRLTDELECPRDRVIAALASLVLVQRKVKVVGKRAGDARFFPNED